MLKIKPIFNFIQIIYEMCVTLILSSPLFSVSLFDLGCATVSSLFGGKECTAKCTFITNVSVL